MNSDVGIRYNHREKAANDMKRILVEINTINHLMPFISFLYRGLLALRFFNKNFSRQRSLKCIRSTYLHIENLETIKRFVGLKCIPKKYKVDNFYLPHFLLNYVL